VKLDHEPGYERDAAHRNGNNALGQAEKTVRVSQDSCEIFTHGKGENDRDAGIRPAASARPTREPVGIRINYYLVSVH